MIPLKIKIALQNSFKCLQEADWAWLWAGATSRLCPHEASQVLRSKAESGRESWRAADLLQPGPVSLAVSVIVTESDRQALLSRLTCDPGSECLEIRKNCEERQAVAPPAGWPSVIPGLPPLGEIAAKIITFYGEHPFFSETFATHIIIIN